MSADEQIIGDAAITHYRGFYLTDLQAKVTANAWHGGQSSPLYAFTSTGAIVEGCLDEVDKCLQYEMSAADRNALAGLRAYVQAFGTRDRVPGWAQINW